LRIAATGSSAGGHLALLLGVTGDDARLEGDVGGNLDQPSRVAAVVDFYGPTDFVLRSKDQPAQTEKESGKVYQLLGGPVRKNVDLAKLASPAWHITAEDPPLLVFHGTADRTVLPNQSHRLRDACKQAGVPMELVFIEGGGHGDSKPHKFATPENEEQLLKFLETYLKAGRDSVRG
jgi:acetyl esterase/lipase